MSNCLGDLQPQLTAMLVKARCGLKLECVWGGEETTCCISCTKLEDCKKVCRKAQDQLIRGIRCPSLKEEAHL